MDNRNEKAADGLRSAENGASEAKLNDAEDSVAGARGTEEAAGGFYSGTGRAKVESDGKKGGFRAWFKKRGPMFFITLALGGGGGLMMGMQTLMPFAIEEMIIEKFNSIGISSTVASDAWLNTQLNYGVRLENLKTGENENLFAFSPYQVQQFEAQGLKVVSFGGTTTQATAILYKKGREWIPVVGSDMLSGSGYSQTDLINAIKAASGLDNVGAPVSAATALSDDDFKNPYTTAGKSWRGGSSGWFDKIMSNVTETKLAIGRNRWARFTGNSLDNLTEKFKETAASAVKAKTKDAKSGAKSSDYKSLAEYESEGWSQWQSEDGVSFIPKEGEWNLTEGQELDGVPMKVTGVEPYYVELEDGTLELDGYYIIGNNNAASVDGATDGPSLESILNNKAMNTASLVAKGIDITCGVAEGLMSIYTVVSAYQSLQFLNLISGYLEAVDKVKAGDGDDSPIHEYNTNLTTRGETKNSEGETVAEKTAMEAAGMDYLFMNTPIDSKDMSVSNVNLESIMTNLGIVTSAGKITAQTFEACGYAKVGASIVELGATILSFVPIIGQTTSALMAVVKIGAKVAVNAIVQAVFAFAIPKITNKIVKTIIKDAATEWFGEDLGNAIVSGAGKYLGGNGTSGGQSPGSKEKVLAYLGTRDTVIAEEARYQRATRSPFDASSPYTFLGTLAYSVLPLAYSTGGVMSVANTATNVTQNALVAMSPTASALGAVDEMNSVGDCVLLDGIGGAGDAYCNAYIITDTSTVDTAPEVVSAIVHGTMNGEAIAAAGSYKDALSKNFNSDGSIKDNSNLSKYIIYCGQRTSQYGVRDATIATQISGGDKPIRRLISVIPLVSDVEAVWQSVEEANGMAWVTGEACIASDENSYWNGDDGENMWYQRYAENMRLVENMNPGYVSPVTAYLQKYYQENPVDDSLEGTIARFAGMTTEQVEDTLALIYYYQFLDEYDPRTVYAFGEPEEEAGPVDYEIGEVGGKIYNIWFNGVEYADVRNRQTTVV